MSAEQPGGATCADVRTAIRTGVVTERVRAHGASCPACAELLADDALLGQFLGAPPADAGPDLSAIVLGRIERERNPVPRAPSLVRAVLVWTSVLLPAAVMLGAKPRPDLARYPVDRMLLVLCALGVAGAIGGLVALRPVHRPAVGRPGAWVATGLLLPVAVAVLPRVENGIAFRWLPTTLHCFETGAAVAAVALLALWLSERRSRPGATWWAAASAVSAIAGGLVLQLACPATGVSHLVAGHASIGLVFAGVAGAAIALRRSFAPSAA